ncbi:hypothetical protein OLMES_1052 [Oleiphilus messinensis]|uniref:Uncharacterized protein n=1 Tax=Oleiphilus messinensis TaxID=141451 RepID=A0A1Y0I3Q7_9GAMM|nr:hypothetical protein [Oleiphilus messinensis]ARU55138.1 hypothetical protein OLMES_1052 [Oleiphilus messinensis]
MRSGIIRPLLLILMLVVAPVRAEYAVIVNPQLEIEHLDKIDIQNIYLAKTGSFPNGEWVIPVDHKKGAPLRNAFYESVLERTEAQLKSYFSRLVFTGKGSPPRTLEDDDSIKKQVQTNKSVIGYVDSKSVDNTVKVVFTFE